MFEQDKGILAHHYIQSFAPNDDLAAEQAYKIGVEFCKKCFSQYQYVVATHKDRSHFHNHIILNSVNLQTGGKWHGNKDSLRYLGLVSDELCVANNLSVIESATNSTSNTTIKSIDNTTYRLAIQGKSWKVELVKLLDEAVENCTSKLQFIDFFNKHNFKIKYTTRNITFQKNVEKKAIRADTLAKQFGEQYTKESLEKSMGCFKLPTIADQKEDWKRYERFFFEQIEKSKKSVVKENNGTVGNIDLQKLLIAANENMMAEINLLDLVKLKSVKFFFCGS